MSAISQQSVTPQIPMRLGTIEEAARIKKAITDGVQQELTRRGYFLNGPINCTHGSQERPGKRARMMDNSSHDTSVSARVVFPNHNDLPVQQNSNIGFQFPGGHPAYGVFLGQNNMGAAYPGPVIGHYDAQNNANLLADHNADPINCRGATGPGLVQNNTNPSMGHEPTQTNHGFVIGGSGVQKRKRAGM